MIKVKKYFNSDIVITDPCYIKNNRNDWIKCNCGSNMEILLKSDHFICEPTLYGDWGCICWKGDEVPRIEWDKIWEKEFNRILKDKIYGKFCADSGQVLVASLKDILNYNPDFINWQITHDWCATIIKDFNGIVEYKIDTLKKENYKYAYLKGIGNKPFITSQTSL